MSRLIEPGPIASKFVETALRNFDANIDEANSHYKEAYARQRARMGRGGSARYKLGPEAVLEKLVHAVEVRAAPARAIIVTTPTRYHGDRPPHPAAAACSTMCSTRHPTSSGASGAS